MARGIKWRMQFKSQNGTGCLVNIWEEDYTSSAVTSKTGADVPFNTENGVIALTGGANPFTFQEDDSESLTDVFRYKTGYIRAVETSYRQLTDLYPETNTQHYVEMFYGSTLAFVGYMQAQSFDNNWVPSPRGLGFPVMSPLGLAEGIRLNAITTPQRVSLASLLHEAIVGLNGAYDKVIIPDVAHSIEGVVNSLVVSPYNPDFTPSIYDNNPVFAPITYADLIEGICNAFGWIVHDTPDALVFTMFDHFGDYAQYTLANLPTMSGKTIVADGSAVVALGTISQVAGNDGKESTILPYKQIKIQYEGGNGTSLSFDFDKVRMYSESHVGSRHCAFLQSMDGRLQTQFPNYYNALDEQTSLVAYPGVMLADCGGDSEMRQCVLVNVDPNWDFVTAPAFSLLFPYPPTVPTILNYKAKFGMWVSGMTDSEEEFEYTHYYFTAYAKVGNKYLLMDGTWGTSGQKRWLYDGIKIPAPPSRDVLELEFWIGDAGTTPQAKLLSVEDISLKEDEEMFGKYKDKHASSDTINGSAGSDEDASISMLFSYVKEGSNMIGDEVYPLPTSYPYLRKAQLRLKAPFKLSVPSYPYCKLIDYWLANKRWRIIAMDFDPWDDKHVLTLHRSPCLDDNASSFSITVAGNVTSDAPSYVQAGAYVQINIFPDDGYDIDYIDVYMGGVNISADAWPGYGNVVNIEEVTGVVSIEVHTAALTYITDGLAYHFDGIEKGGDSTKWTDLVSGEYFTLNSHSSVDDNSVIMDGSGYLTGSAGMAKGYTLGTIEACVERTSGTSSAIIFFSSGTSGLSVIISSTGMCFAGASSCQFNLTRANKFVWSSTNQMCIYNGAKYTSKSNNTWSNSASVATLGGRNNGTAYYFAGKIHSIRIYNRKLTEDEMRHNQSVDNYRFNMGLSL